MTRGMMRFVGGVISKTSEVTALDLIRKQAVRQLSAFMSMPTRRMRSWPLGGMPIGSPSTTEATPTFGTAQATLVATLVSAVESSAIAERRRRVFIAAPP
jgi:hypothetical protein